MKIFVAPGISKLGTINEITHAIQGVGYADLAFIGTGEIISQNGGSADVCADTIEDYFNGNYDLDGTNGCRSF